MTIDERIEALTMNLELPSHESAKHDGQLRELIRLSNQDGEHIRELANLAKTASEQIASLASIAATHERRITAVEEGR